MEITITESGYYFIEFTGEGYIENNPKGIGYYKIFKNNGGLERTERKIGYNENDIYGIEYISGLIQTIQVSTTEILKKDDIIRVKFKYENKEECQTNIIGSFIVGKRNLSIIKGLEI